MYDKKKLAIFSKLKGQTVANAKITNEMCSQVGKVLAQLHMYSEDFKKNFSGVRNRDWFLNTYNNLSIPSLNPIFISHPNSFNLAFEI